MVDDPAARPRRRTFSAEYQARILAEYDAVPTGSSERGALLRREGLYTSHIAEWRKARDTAGLDALAPKARPAKRSAEQVELEKLRRRTARLEAELARTRLALEITGKAHALLEMLSESADTEGAYPSPVDALATAAPRTRTSSGSVPATRRRC